MGLEKYYAGDGAFAKYASACLDMLRDHWAAWPHRQALIEACKGDAQIAIAAYSLAGDHALEWMDDVVPALDGWAPRRCLETPKGRMRLKEALLRSPC